ncbi:hypothetical protein [Methylobacterium sp. WL6]|uniref:hypothetical protein n=1 Tax=Methylobacterium sp. WL6 TaxID=2603901 RepID=UPI0011CBB6D7|nr:hypothetical protein [Methylobacterium sp. WL6]TXN73265.1 hypothetical protein FV230_01985 [Methylobacterium sp. WL6]
MIALYSEAPEVAFTVDELDEYLTGMKPVVCADGVRVRLQLTDGERVSKSIGGALLRYCAASPADRDAAEADSVAWERSFKVIELGRAFERSHREDPDMHSIPLVLERDHVRGRYLVTETCQGARRVAFRGDYRDSPETVIRLARAYCTGATHAREDAERAGAAAVQAEAERKAKRTAQQKARRAADRAARTAQALLDGEPDIDAVLAIMASTGPMTRTSA